MVSYDDVRSAWHVLHLGADDGVNFNEDTFLIPEGSRAIPLALAPPQWRLEGMSYFSAAANARVTWYTTLSCTIPSCKRCKPIGCVLPFLISLRTFDTPRYPPASAPSCSTRGWHPVPKDSVALYPEKRLIQYQQPSVSKRASCVCFLLRELRG